MLHLYDTTNKEGDIPNDWSEGLIIFIHMKRNHLNTSNYRDNSISNLLGKLFFKIRTRRMHQHMYAREIWEVNQCDHEPDYRTEDNLFINILLHQMYCVAENQNIYSAFVDFTNFFI